jgi:hypothetical protein
VQALAEDFCGTDDDHILIKMFLPGSTTPQISVHVSAKHVHGLIQIGLEDRMLLED